MTGGWAATFENITERLTAEERLRERKLAALVAHLPGMAYRGGAAAPRPVEYASEGAAPLTGYPADDFTSGRLAWGDVMHPEDAEAVQVAVDEAVAGRRPFSITYRIVHRLGDVRSVQERGQPVFAPSGELEAIEGFVGDASEQMGAEAALWASEIRLQAIVEATPECVKIVDADGRLLHMNPAGLRMIDAPDGASLAGTEICSLVVPEDRAEWRRHHARVIAGERCTWEFDVVGLAGTRRSMETHAVPLPLPDGTVAHLALTRDMTDRKIAEARLRQLQAELFHVSRMSSMGAIGAAIAHELNQPLAAAANYLQAGVLMLQRRADGDPDLLTLLNKAAEQTLRAGEIVKRVRSLVSQGQATVAPEDLATLVKEANVLALAGARAAGVTFRLDCADRLTVAADRVQIQQVLLNLMRNAVEAMADAERRHLVVSTAKAGDEALICVQDTGPGLPEAVRAKLFAPFTSTKHDGMGVGLSICRTIVEGHNGRIWAEDVSDGGTRFCFTLPLAKAAADGARASTAA